MSDAGQIRLGLIGYGEIGSTLGAGLRRSGLAEVLAYDKHAFDGPYAGLIQRRAQEAGVPLLCSAAALAERTDVIIGATPGSSCIASSSALAMHLGPRHLVMDIASATPKVKQAVAALLASSGAAFADGSIVGTPKDGHGMPILAAGLPATRVRDALVSWGMNITVAGEHIGDASAIKILRSVVMKGLEALLLECLIGARRYGIEDAVLESLGKTFAKPFDQVVQGVLTTNAIHAGRRAEEAAMSAETLADVGLDSFVTRAVAERLRWVAELGMKEHFGGAVPLDWQAALDGIEEKLAGR